ncbi:unnamed protein product [Ascophyllum nodosum]
MTALDLSSNRPAGRSLPAPRDPRAYVLGLWRADGPTRSWSVHSGVPGPPLPHQDLAPAEETLAQGELLRLSLVAGGFLWESVAPNGTSHCIFAIRASTTPSEISSWAFSSLRTTPSQQWVATTGRPAINP